MLLIKINHRQWSETEEADILAQSLARYLQTRRKKLLHVEQAATPIESESDPESDEDLSEPETDTEESGGEESGGEEPGVGSPGVRSQVVRSQVVIHPILILMMTTRLPHVDKNLGLSSLGLRSQEVRSQGVISLHPTLILMMTTSLSSVDKNLTSAHTINLLCNRFILSDSDSIIGVAACSTCNNFFLPLSTVLLEVLYM